MEITSVDVKKVAGDGQLKAYITVTFDNCFVVHNVKVIEGERGVFVSMPSRRMKSGKFKDMAHPINTGFRAIIEGRVLEEYRKVPNLAEL